MLIDHIGAVYFPDITLFRIAGRLAFPLFAYCVTIGFQHTHNLKRYISRILLCGFISQPLSIAVFHILRFNVLFTLALGLGALWAIREKRFWILCLFLFLSLAIPIEYGPSAVLLMLVFYLFKDDREGCIILSIFVCLAYTLGSIQMFMLLALPFIFLPKIHFKAPTLNKRFFYWFYPVHLLLLSLFSFL